MIVDDQPCSRGPLLGKSLRVVQDIHAVIIIAVVVVFFIARIKLRDEVKCREFGGIRRKSTKYRLQCQGPAFDHEVRPHLPLHEYQPHGLKAFEVAAHADPKIDRLIDHLQDIILAILRDRMPGRRGHGEHEAPLGVPLAPRIDQLQREDRLTDADGMDMDRPAGLEFDLAPIPAKALEQPASEPSPAGAVEGSASLAGNGTSMRMA